MFRNKRKRGISGDYYLNLSPKGIPQLSTFHCQLSTERSDKFQFPLYRNTVQKARTCCPIFRGLPSKGHSKIMGDRSAGGRGWLLPGRWCSGAGTLPSQVRGQGRPKLNFRFDSLWSYHVQTVPGNLLLFYRIFALGIDRAQNLS